MDTKQQNKFVVASIKCAEEALAVEQRLPEELTLEQLEQVGGGSTPGLETPRGGW